MSNGRALTLVNGRALTLDNDRTLRTTTAVNER